MNNILKDFSFRDFSSETILNSKYMRLFGLTLAITCLGIFLYIIFTFDTTLKEKQLLKEEIIAYECGKDGWAVATDKIIPASKTKNKLPCDLPIIREDEMLIIYEHGSANKCKKGYIIIHLFNKKYKPINPTDKKVHKYVVAKINTIYHQDDYFYIKNNINNCVKKPKNMTIITKFKVKKF